MNDESLFHLALEKPAAERPVFLEQACSGDTALQRRVEALIRSHETPDSFLVMSAKNPEVTTDSNAGGMADESTGRMLSAEGPGTRIGPYKLLQPIGEGGMGTVYMAEQTQPVRRTVALKLIKAGMDSRQVLARFGAERQALALMDHPSIAKVFDAGTTDTGRPYFVMELVKGIPITRFCDERRLTTARAARARHPGLPGRATRPPEGDHPPRSQAVQRLDRALRRQAGAQGDRLRRCQGDRSAAD